VQLNRTRACVRVCRGGAGTWKRRCYSWISQTQSLVNTWLPFYVSSAANSRPTCSRRVPRTVFIVQWPSFCPSVRSTFVRAYDRPPRHAPVVFTGGRVFKIIIIFLCTGDDDWYCASEQLHGTDLSLAVRVALEHGTELICVMIGGEELDSDGDWSLYAGLTGILRRNLPKPVRVTLV